MLEARELSYTYRTKYQVVHALNGVSAEFAPGKLYAIVGPSGSGKTTLLSLLAGLDVPTEGAVLWNGRSTAELDRDQYRMEHVSVIYQNFNLFAHLTVLENAAYPLYLRKCRNGEALAKEKLLAVGLREEHLKRTPNMLSGGEQQRVAIARALTAGSEVILADEPTGNLDGENSKNIMRILKNLAYEQGRCVIVVTHDPAAAGEADEILQMRDGRWSA